MWKKLREKQRNRQECTTAAAVVRILGGKFLEVHSIAALACIGAGIGIGIATSKAAEAVARQPEAESKITKILLLGGALAEATAIYGFVIGILIILFMA